jgi:hypothetical protein
MRCGDWVVHLTNRGGQLSGSVALNTASVTLHNLNLRPDGTFSGESRPGVVGARNIRAYRVNGRFSGDVVELSLDTDLCPARSGTATRRSPHN